MKRKSRPSFEQMIDLLRTKGFAVTPFAAVEGALLVSKFGAGAVVTASKAADGPALVVAVHPGMVVKGEVARLVDRGYQKFVHSSHYDLPATAGQLHAIHAFSEELKQLAGEESLYNESLGTTSDLYRYDRLSGREAAVARPR